MVPPDLILRFDYIAVNMCFHPIYLFFLLYVSLFFIKKENSFRTSPLVSKRVVTGLEVFQTKIAKKCLWNGSGIFVCCSVGKYSNSVRDLVYYFFIFNMSLV
ncbi:hypothetical protein LEP1GSC036_2972 [Leptospira weilii str. 2006001853]|uniref:Uncharacterized protein n=2 Tax=Leptospira weilii TaxID=28184 RepID=A0A828Z5S9_9LEPT|nr:hypothetical protein LEP1GSC036_2972 [Leptospira weilii str. 2006001853]EMN42414.1 hypothetical protein LEP1GSC086_0059 [Leptospira weilii str. LNT 1234]EMN88405.1 hypothetical protein LEP1GSC108_1991 [Leptospira weilii str. UI 13098]OMI18253.1 hypothetical protein BUQ74_06055 [Leptospira weilii serovar Heyan]QDK22703.1 hypothetical protein FHG67_08315 [Leptospira weilii]